MAGAPDNAGPPPPPAHLRRPTAATADLLAQLRAMGLHNRRSSSGGKERSYAGIAASRSNSGRWRPATKPDGGTVAAVSGPSHARQLQQPSAYFAAAATPPARCSSAAAAFAAIMTPDDMPAAAACTPVLDGRAASSTSITDDDALLFHMSGLKQTDPSANLLLERSKSMTQAGHTSPPAVQRSFSFMPEPEPSPRGAAAAPVPMQHSPHSSRSKSCNTLEAATTAPAAVTQETGLSRSATRRLLEGHVDLRSAAEHAAAAQPPAWSDELLSWMLNEKAELLVQLQRAQRERADLAAELERAQSSRSVDDGELARLQVGRRVQMSRCSFYSRGCPPLA